MANLLSWLGGGVKRVANTVNNDVLQPINRDVYQPIQRNTVQPINRDIVRPTMNSPVGGIIKATSPGYHIANLLASTFNGNTQNAVQQSNQDLLNLAHGVTRPVAETALTLTHPFTQHTSGAPTNPLDKLLWGDQPIQNINKKVATNYNAHPNLPLPARLGLAGGEAGLSLLQDVPILTGAGAGAKELASGFPEASRAALASEAGYLSWPGSEKLTPAEYKAEAAKRLSTAADKQFENPTSRFNQTITSKDRAASNRIAREFQRNPQKFMDKYQVEQPPALLGKSPDKNLTPDNIPIKPAGQGSVNLSPQEIAVLKKQGYDDAMIQKITGVKSNTSASGVIKTTKKSAPKPQGDIIPQVSSEGKITRFTSLANRLSKLGEGGTKTLQTIRNKEIAAYIHTQELGNIAKPFLNLSKEEQASAIKVHKGEFTTESPSVQAGADSLKAMFKEAHQRAVNAKIKVGNQGENYFPQSYPREWFKDLKSINKAAQQLVANGQAPNLETAIGKLNKIKIEGSVNPGTYGHFKPRTTNLPGIENAKTVINYIRGSSDAIAQAEHFGSKNGVLKSHIATAIRNGEDATALRDITSNYLHPHQPGLGPVSKGLNLYQKGLRVIQLPRAAVSHASQGVVNTGADVGWGNYMRALGQKVKISVQDEKFLNDNGFRADKIAPAEGLSGKATAPGLGHLLQFHRDVAALAGKNIAEGLAKNGDEAGLRNIGIDGKLARDSKGNIKLTELQQAKAGHFEANKSIGSSSRLESPAWTQTEGGKLVGMYRKMYTFKQAERIGEWMKEAKNGNPEPIIRFLTAATATGAAIALTKDQIKNPGTNPINDKGKLALDTIHNSGIGSIGYGTVDSGINAASHNYGNDSRWSNAANAVSPAAGFTVQTGQNIAKATHGNVKPLERQGLQSLPVGGTALANKLAPATYTPNVPTTGGSNNALNTSANNAATKSIKTKLENGNLDAVGLQQLPNGDYAYAKDGKVAYTSSLKTAQTQIAKDYVASQPGSYKVIGDKVYRKNADGTVGAPISKTSFDYQIGQANLIGFKNSDNLQGYIKTANSQLNSIQQQLKDPNIDPLEAAKLQNDATTLQNNIDKYSGYGGFTKPKTGRSGGASTSFKTASKVSAPKIPKITIRKQANFKGPSVRKLSVSKIPTSYKGKSVA